MRRVRVFDVAFQSVEFFSELTAPPTDCPDGADDAVPGSGEVRRRRWLVAGIRAGSAGDAALCPRELLALTRSPARRGALSPAPAALPMQAVKVQRGL